MRIVVQRVKHASCMVDNVITGKIEKGFLLFIGFKDDDSINEIDLLVKKVSGLRVFEDEAGKMNKSLNDIKGSILAISQFTLYADCKHGNRPSFTKAMKFDIASANYDLFCNKLKDLGFIVEKGIFGADMRIDLVNDGPVTIILDTDEL